MIHDNDSPTQPAGLRTQLRGLARIGFMVVTMILMLMLVVFVRPRGSQAFLLGCCMLGELAVLLLALRLPQPQGWRWRQLGTELAIATVLMVTMSLIYTLITLILWLWHGSTYLSLFLIAAVILHGLTYLSLRSAMQVIGWWNRLRQQRLLWALTHDQLVVVLALMLGVGSVIVLCFLGVALMNDRIPNAFALRALVPPSLNFSQIGMLYLGAAMATLIVAPPLALLLSSILARRIVRRVEVLAAATDALQRGNYAARVAVVGQDEIARLQANFNAMAAELDRTLGELQAERDRAAGLLQAQRELIASVSHELRTPVAIQRAYLDTMLDTLLPQDTDRFNPIAADLAVVERETQRLQILIDDLFTLSRAEIGRLTLTLQPLDLDPIIERVVATLAPLAWRSGRIELVAQLESRAPTLVLADEGRFEQILRNLIHNAIRHTPPGGLIVVARFAEDKSLDKSICVQVRDTGSGIAPADLPQIWNRFYRADTSRATDQSGAGLGLALVKELTETMGGSVDVTSTVGVGSTFTIYLPLAARHSAS